MKNISRRSFLKSTLGGAVSVAAMGLAGGAGIAMAENAPTAIYTPGTYTSCRIGSFATVEVSCSFSETALTDVSYRVLRTSASDYFTPFAGPLGDYCTRIVEAGKAVGVDGVAGATISSNMIRDGVNACFAQALGLPAAAAIASPLNPQDEYFDGCDSDLAGVFSPIKLGTMELSNRVAKSAGSSPWKDPNEDTCPVSEALYGAMAENGVSLNIFAGGVIRNDLILPGNVNKEGEDTAEAIAAGAAHIKPVIDRIHAAGGKVGYQLCYGGLAPTVPDEMINDVTVEDLDAFIETVGISAARGKAAGFDCIEIKGASGDGLNGFMTRRTNIREDEYGAQNTENRTRLFRRCIEKIKEVNGADFPVGALINAVEENDLLLGDNDGFTTIEEGKEIAKALVDAGADWIQVRVGAVGREMNIWAPDVQHIVPGADGITGYGTMFDYSAHFDGMLDGSHSGFASFLPLVKAIKEAVDVPVGCAGDMDLRLGPDFLNAAIKNGELDLIFMNRPLNCDPELVRKMQEGRREDVRPCMHCMHCHDGQASGKRLKDGCRMNAASYHAFTDAMPEGFDPLPAETVKNVLVIGAGPAGMEAACVAAERGHKVTLCEASYQLGGMMHFAQGVKGNHERFTDYFTYSAARLEKAGVEVKLSTRVDTEKVRELAPDAVVVAAGGVRANKFVGENVFSPEQAFGSSEMGEKVVILGANVQAVDYAARLVADGKKVTIVNPNAEILFDDGQSGWFRIYMKSYLFANGVKSWNESEVKAIAADAVTIITKTGAERTIPCDSIVDFSDMLPNTDLVSEIEALGVEVVAVGDCKAPHNIREAVTSGNLAARAL